ncbi:hypothetical protein DB354_14380 [Opitutus sp. ER46]|nr:hypothetical protein DB354_14380 [Opitutus sp. ER46]
MARRPAQTTTITPCIFSKPSGSVPARCPSGYALLPSARRQGYALEAAQGMVGYARGKLGIKALNGLVEPSNLASVRILEALGMRHQRTFTMAGYPGLTAIYSTTF